MTKPIDDCPQCGKPISYDSFILFCPSCSLTIDLKEDAEQYASLKIDESYDEIIYALSRLGFAYSNATESRTERGEHELAKEFSIKSKTIYMIEQHFRKLKNE